MSALVTTFCGQCEGEPWQSEVSDSGLRVCNFSFGELEPCLVAPPRALELQGARPNVPAVLVDLFDPGAVEAESSLEGPVFSSPFASFAQDYDDMLGALGIPPPTCLLEQLA